MDPDARFEEWIKVSVATARFDHFMLPLIQSLGKMDTDLIKADVEYLENFETLKNSIDESEKLGERITASYLWVLGSYEVIRTMSQRISDGVVPASNELAEHFRSVKNDFNRLRVPLAKFEPSQRHKSTDSHIAFPGVHLDHGISWQVSEDTHIARRELSDKFLALLAHSRNEKIKSSNET